jgi:hypothetical protein
MTVLIDDCLNSCIVMHIRLNIKSVQEVLVESQGTVRFADIGFTLWKYIPKTEGLVTAASNNSTSVRAECYIENTQSVTDQCIKVFEITCFPKHNLILSVTMRRD